MFSDLRKISLAVQRFVHISSVVSEMLMMQNDCLIEAR